MANELHIGTVDLGDSRPGANWPRHFARLSYLEWTGTFVASPKATVLPTWAAEGQGRLGLHAPWVVSHRKLPSHLRAPAAGGAYATDAVTGDFRGGAAALAAVDRAAQFVADSKARVIVFSSDPMFSPSQANRDHLTAFFAEVAPAEKFPTAMRVWIPGGLWDPYQAATFANRLGLVASVDPFANSLDRTPDWVTGLPGDHIYFRPTNAGRTSALSLERLEDLAGWLDHYAAATVAFATVARRKDAESLIAVTSGSAGGAEDNEEDESGDA